MKAVISVAYGWDEEAQRGIAAESLAGQIVLVDEKPVGVLTLLDWGDQLHLSWIAVLPEMQGQGLGAELLKHCRRRAIEAGKPITLQVLRNNPAIRLYERFGFKTYAYDGQHKVLMRWNHNAE
jgi:ribosomal protein S18 acetylase RimI-like enzyme